MNPISFSDLNGKVGVITGGSGILGTAMAKAMSSVGIKIAIISRHPIQQLADDISKEFGNQVVCIAGDVLDKESLIQAKKEINQKLGDIDLLINCAGGNQPTATTKVEQMDENSLNHLEDTFYGLKMDGFDKVFALNFKGTLLPTMVFTTDMLKNKKGVVLNVSSMNSYKPLTKIPAYSAAKASVNNFTEWLAVHLAKVGIRVNAIAPGFFISDQNRFLVLDPATGNFSARGQKIVNNTPMGKFGQPEDLQGATLFLLSDISSFITGIVIPVDGGFSAFGGV